MSAPIRRRLRNGLGVFGVDHHGRRGPQTGAERLCGVPATLTLILASSAIFYHFVIDMPARDARLDADRRATEIAAQAELCRKMAQDNFEKNVGQAVTNTQDGQNMNGYVNHYNPELGICFNLSIVNSYHTKASPPYSTESIGLLDLNEGKGYGNYFKRQEDTSPFLCDVLGKKCSSRDEWISFANPYIGDLKEF